VGAADAVTAGAAGALAGASGVAFAGAVGGAAGDVAGGAPADVADGVAAVDIFSGSGWAGGPAEGLIGEVGGTAGRLSWVPLRIKNAAYGFAVTFMISFGREVRSMA
jgi:hypothetical protein